MKYRHELKYICSETELCIIENRIKNICKKDPHVGKEGLYQIRSIYFDDYNNTCFYENENGVDPREKIRIRAYNCDDSHISLEKKKKEHSMTQKLQRAITKEEYEEYISTGYVDSRLGLMEPKVIVAYERIPYIYEIGNVRITIDRNISCSNEFDLFFDKDIPLRPVMEKGKNLLEVKYDEILPDYLYTMMNLGTLTQTAFSKYYLCRKFLSSGIRR